MDPRLSMNTSTGPVDYDDIQRRAREYGAQRAEWERGHQQMAASSQSAFEAQQHMALEAARAAVPLRESSRPVAIDVNSVGADMDSGLHGGAMHQTEKRAAMHNAVYGRGVPPVEMYRDRPLVDALCARLAGYAGEGGRNEGAVEALDRLLAEVRGFRKHIGRELRQWVHESADSERVFSWTPDDVERILKDLEHATRAVEEARVPREPPAANGHYTGAPERPFQRSDILAIIRGQKAIATSFQAREALDAMARIITNLED